LTKSKRPEMTDNINREELIGLLGTLGAEKDEDVLSTAREIHAQVTAAGHDWNDLLVGDGDEGNQPASQADDKPAPAPAPTSGDVPDDTEALSLIERILQKTGVSNDLREELEGYREDISEGEFEEIDRNYLRSLYERMKDA